MTRGQLPRGRREGRALLAAGGVDPADHERGLRRPERLRIAAVVAHGERLRVQADASQGVCRGGSMLDFDSNLSRALRRGVRTAPLVRRPSGADYDASSRSRSPRANEPSRDAAARDVSAVTARVHIEVSAPSSRDSPGQHLQYRRPTNSPKAGLTFTFDYFAHAILLTRPDLR